MEFSEIKFNKIHQNEGFIRFSKYALYRKGDDLVLFDLEDKIKVNLGSYGEVKMFLSDVKEEEGEIVLIKEGGEIIRLSFFYPEKGIGGIRVDSYSIKLREKLSENISCDSKLLDVLIVDIENKKYIMINDMKKKYGANIEVEEFALSRIFEKNSAFIITDKGVYVVLRGERSFISKSRLGLDTKKIREWIRVNDRGKDYLLLATKLKVIVISLEGEDKFYFGVFDRNKEDLSNFKVD